MASRTRRATASSSVTPAARAGATAEAHAAVSAARSAATARTRSAYTTASAASSSARASARRAATRARYRSASRAKHSPHRTCPGKRRRRHERHHPRRTRCARRPAAISLCIAERTRPLNGLGSSLHSTARVAVRARANTGPIPAPESMEDGVSILGCGGECGDAGCGASVIAATTSSRARSPPSLPDERVPCTPPTRATGRTQRPPPTARASRTSHNQ